MLDECYVDEEFIVPFPCQIYIFILFYVVCMTIYTFLMHICIFWKILDILEILSIIHWNFKFTETRNETEIWYYKPTLM